MEEILHFRLLYLYNMCWKTQNIPLQWQHAQKEFIKREADTNARIVGALNYLMQHNFEFQMIEDNFLVKEQMGFRTG